MWCQLAAKKHEPLVIMFFVVLHRIIIYSMSLTFGSFWHMHQQVLFSGGRIAVGRLQTLVLCVKLCHSDSSSCLTE